MHGVMPRSKVRRGRMVRPPSERTKHLMKRILSAAVLAVALPFTAFAQAPATSGSSDTSTAAPATKSESKTESKTSTQADGSVKTEKKHSEKKAKKTAPRHKAAKRSGEQATQAPVAK